MGTTSDSAFVGCISSGKWHITLNGEEAPAFYLCEPFLVPEGRLTYLRERVKKIARLAERLGVPGPDVRVIGAAERKINRASEPDRWELRHLVTATGLAPRLPGGWRFVATIEHTLIEGEWLNVLRSIPSYEGALPAAYRTDAPTCDHCGTARRRKATYVAVNTEGEMRRVGGVCLSYYLGGVTPAQVASLAQYERELATCWDDEEGGGCGGTEIRFGVLDYLAAVTSSIERDGWLSRGAARDSFERVTATADAAWREECVREGFAKRGRTEPKPPVLNEKDFETARKVLDWCRAIDPETESDYLHNLRVVSLAATVTARGAGILASAVSAYTREMERELQRQRESSRHFAEPGDKIGRKLSTADKRKGATAHTALDVEVLSVRHFDTRYGSSSLITWAVTTGEYEGCLIKWFASGVHNYEPGTTGTLVATVKQNDNYKGRLETTVNRAVFTVPESAEEAA